MSAIETHDYSILKLFRHGDPKSVESVYQHVLHYTHDDRTEILDYAGNTRMIFSANGMVTTPTGERLGSIHSREEEYFFKPEDLYKIHESLTIAVQKDSDEALYELERKVFKAFKMLDKTPFQVSMDISEVTPDWNVVSSMLPSEPTVMRFSFGKYVDEVCEFFKLGDIFSAGEASRVVSGVDCKFFVYKYSDGAKALHLSTKASPFSFEVLMRGLRLNFPVSYLRKQTLTFNNRYAA